MKIDSIFADALQKSTPVERDAFLAEACGDDLALRQRVERLLALHEHSGGILERAEDTGAFVPSPVEASLAPDRLFAGRFKLREKLGEGGMGEVWVADQLEPVQRRVALKVIRPGLDSARLLARFEQERQALALMDHPNIAKVLDAGVTEGHPYFVMELIKGVAITKYCDEAKLSPRERLELFIPVCQAVQHAHQKGIIHRDVKPSNILVALYDGQPVPKVIDFGVAKATGPRLSEQSIYTEVGSLIGTLEYMSPEQAELNNLDIDTRSDIYSLGVVLYELLTGSVPFSRKELQSAAFIEMLRMIKEVEPPRPSTKLSGSGTLPSVAAVRRTEPKKLMALIRGELDWIVMKCLEKDRARRYETANGLARDLQRYLADEPVVAGPPSAGYKLRKFVHRNQGRILATAALVLLIIAGITAVAVVQARADRDRAAAETDRATREAWATASVAAAVREARERVDEAWKASDYPDRMQLATDAAVAALRRADDYAAGGPPTESSLAELDAAHHDVDDLARHTRLITTHAKNVQRFIDELHLEGQGNPIWVLCQRHGEALRQFGLDPVNGSAEEMARAVVVSRIRDALLGILLEWHHHAANFADQSQGFYKAPALADEARTVKDRLEQVIRPARQLSGGAYARWQDLQDRNDVPGLMAFAASPDGLGFRSILVAALGRDLRRAKEHAAERTFLRAAVDRYPQDMMLHYDLAGACQSMQPPEWAESLCHVSAARTLRPDSTLFNLQVGGSYASLGNHAQAVAAFRRTITLNPKYDVAHQWLGSALMNQKDWNGAIAAYRDFIRLAPQSASGHLALGVALTFAGRHSEALQVTLAALEQNPTWANNPRNLLRYTAACSAVNCTDGKGANAPPPAERPMYRKQAYELLTAEMAALRKLVATDRGMVLARMELLLKEEKLASVRDPMAVDQLPAEERDAWNKLWAEVREAVIEPRRPPRQQRR